MNSSFIHPTTPLILPLLPPLSIQQVRKRDTGEVFAMKVMRKDRVLGKGHGGYVRAERDALTAVVHPYVVTLRYSFQVRVVRWSGGRVMEFGRVCARRTVCIRAGGVRRARG